MNTSTLALIIFAAILIQVAVFMFMGYQRRKNELINSSTTHSTFKGESATAPTPSNNPPISWEGFREFIVQRKVVEDDAQSICSFYLVPEDGLPLPAFKAGQFLTFRLNVTNPSTGNSTTVIRCYSLSDAPNTDYYRVSIKRVPAPPNHPEYSPGLSSNHFHDHIHEGSRLEVRAPSGHFYCDGEGSRPVVLIAGGIGITPMLSIVNTLLNQNDKRDIYLFYGVRNGHEQIMKHHLRSLSEDIDNFHLHLCYSSPNSDDQEGVDFQHHGRVDVTLLKNTLKYNRYQFFVCGPKTMMESIVPDLETWGVSHDDIFYESFGPATLIKPSPLATDDEIKHPINITFSQSGKKLAWDPSYASILEFAEANQIKVESGCRAGSCGCCQTEISKGDVHYLQETDVDISDGHCLICVTIPENDLILNV